MRDAKKVYTKILSTLNNILPSTPKNHVHVMALMLYSLVRKQNCHLTQLAQAAPSHAKNESISRRFQRFLSNSKIDPLVLMKPFAQKLLHSFRHKQLLLALDVSDIGRDCAVLMLGLVYKGRLFPLTWRVVKGKKGHWSAEAHVDFAKQVRQLIGERKNIIILGDGEYDNVSFLQYLSQECGWDFVVRTMNCTTIHTEKGPRSLKRVLPVEKSQTLSIHHVNVTKYHFGPIHVVAHWKEKEKQPWYLLTTVEQPHRALNFYRKRFMIETFFSDQKSRGFGLQKSHLRCPLRLSRLLLLCSLGYLWMLHLGVEVVASGQVDLLDRSVKRQDKSLFRLGLSWLERQLKNGGRFLVRFTLSQKLVHSDIWLARHWYDAETVM